MSILDHPFAASGGGFHRLPRAAPSIFQACFEASPTGMIAAEAIRDARGAVCDLRVLAMNASAERTIGTPACQLISRGALESFPGLTASGLFEAYARVIETGQPYHGELHYTYDTLDLWVEVDVTRHGDGVIIAFSDVTRQKVAEEAAREAADRHDRIIECVSDIIYVVGRDGNFRSSTSSFERVTGWPRSTWMGKSFVGLIHPDDLPSVFRCFHEALAGMTCTFETRVHCADGSYRTFQLSAAPYVELGQITGALGVARDITQHKAHEDALARLAAVVESSDDAITTETLDGVFTSWNPGAEALFGYPAAEMIGQSVARLYPPDLRDELPSILERLRRGERVAHYGTRRLRKDGTIAHVSLSIFPIRDKDGKVVAISKIARDIRRQRAAEEALRLSEERYRLVNCATNDIVWDWDLPTDCLFWSDSFYKVFGYMPENTPASTAFWSGCIHPDDRDRVMTTLHQALDGGAESWSAEYRLRRADGAYAIVFDRGFVARDATGKAVRMIGAMQDISDRRRAEEQLRTNEEFLRRIIESSADCIKTLDLDGRLLWMNPCGLRLMEIRDFSAVRNMQWLNVWCNETRNRAREAIAAAKSGAVGSFEGFCPTMGGVLKWWHVIITPILGADGMPERLLCVSRDVTDRHRAEERLAFASTHDGLTSLPNRAFISERIAGCIRRAQADPGFKYAVLFLDLDRFKLINDSLGHAAGDQLIRRVAERLQGCLPTDDAGGTTPGAVVARLGGDEFTILLEGPALVTEVTSLAERIVHAMAQPFDIDGRELFTSTSVGVALGTPTHSAPDELLRDADAAMYRAKSDGKGRCALFDVQMHQAAVDRLRLETELRHAIDRDELHLHYQPIVSLTSGHLHGFEALLRWSRNGTLVSPADFIPVAEDTGMIIPIGRWVLEQGCRQLAVWQSRYGRPLSLSVNVSRKQFADAGLVPHLQRVLSETGIAPASLKVEITESAMTADSNEAREILLRMKAAGVRLAMDDFGTGYSSLSCLRNFPIDVLKIDRSFIHGLEGQRDAAAVVDSIVGLAHNLGMSVVAEGLETPDQVAFLQGCDCDFGQGFYFAAPLSREAAEGLLQGLPALAFLQRNRPAPAPPGMLRV
jgi:diguanylate cyclase (GGDEF)-like protein/PAS domain S-box-containing protein